MAGNSHEEETSPLHANLCYSKQGGGTWEWADLLAAGHILGALRQRENVRDENPGISFGMIDTKHVSVGPMLTRLL